MTDWPGLLGSVAAVLVAAGTFWRTVRRTNRVERKVDQVAGRVDQAEAAHAQTRALITRYVEEAHAAAAARTRRATDRAGATGADPPAVAAATAAATTAASAATAAATVATTAIEQLKTEDRESRREQVGLAAAQLLVEIADRTKDIEGHTSLIADKAINEDQEKK